ncbi:hypothetical protein M3J07_006844 [Ascochyta lentis]
MPPDYRRLLPASTDRRRESSSLVPDKSKRVVACQVCREKRRKCTGQRPTCEECRTRSIDCRYEFQPGLSRSATLKLRSDRVQDNLSTTMELYWYLQTQSKQDAVRTLDLIQSGLKPGQVLEQLKATSGSPEEPSAEPESATIIGPPKDASTSTDGLTSSPDLEPLQDSAFHPSNVIPVLTRGVESFLLCTGCIFHIYDSSDARAKLDVVRCFIQEEGESWAQPCHGDSSVAAGKAMLTPVCIMAALGLQYTKDPIPALDLRPSSEDGTHRYVSTLYEVAKRFLDDLIERDVLEAMKAYMGINVASNNDLPFLSESRGLGAKDGPSYKRVLRTLVTLHDWLVSTLGFIPKDLFGSQAKILPFVERDPVAPSEIIQRELSKVVHIEADLLRTIASFNTITTPLFAYVRRDLMQWHKDLPVWMRLESLVKSNFHPVETKRTIYLVHLFYLSANILVARLAHKQLSDCSPHERNDEMRIAIGDGLVAARTAARILQLQLDDLTIYQRCWCCEFTAYMSCLTLLHSTTQLLLHGHSQPIWQKELSYAKSCIDVLEHCGLVDKVALSFLRITTSYYNTLLAEADSNISISDKTLPDEFDHLFNKPESTHAPLATASEGLLELLIHPFGTPTDFLIENTLKAGFSPGSDGGQDLFSTPPQDGTASVCSDKLVSLRKAMSSSLQSSRLLGSSQPHNWSSILNTDTLQ